MSDRTELLNRRYGVDVFHTDIRWNETITNLLSHRSIRAYLSEPLPPNTLETLVAAAQSASTSSNLQTWSVVAVEDAQRKEKLSQLANNQAHIRQCPLFLVWLADLARLTYIADSQGLPHEGLNYLEMFLVAAIDAALAAQNAVVAAESLGLGTVYIGALRNHPEAVAEVLNLPPHIVTVFGLCVGYADSSVNVEIKPRLPQAAVLHRETYQLEKQDQEIELYNQIMKQFYDSQQMNVPGDWSEHSAKRVAFPESLSGRDKLRQVLNHLGFELR
ncbi:NADPH-dependent oxidoreductase [Nostoc spongiaeforme FACHB-130]|uniref:NADPH-dependent oxidoreductase n=1 Tax=Nostoc spongiaeforme FACHB-130 TaxID=1357510 RepID=A0ABR8FXH9_9NOSO|nr:NADPH-dependent oxidoreductase [Nostoc spongiaeforme]MBD2595640.1 NADPH-dependent oxidoreductase [Nostoc spongiaeforme FACHB-130]